MAKTFREKLKSIADQAERLGSDLFMETRELEGYKARSLRRIAQNLCNEAQAINDACEGDIDPTLAG